MPVADGDRGGCHAEISFVFTGADGDGLTQKTISCPARDAFGASLLEAGPSIKILYVVVDFLSATIYCVFFGIFAQYQSIVASSCFRTGFVDFVAEWTFLLWQNRMSGPMKISLRAVPPLVCRPVPWHTASHARSFSAGGG
ncbi:MAG: hypothetical protein WC003_01505 [Terrimicrobiaceae bacterium]